MTTFAPRHDRPPAPAKVKILEVADTLFYTEGIHTVGVDRIIQSARVTKATFYKHYRSKDLLIVAYVQRRHEQAVELFEQARAGAQTPADELRALSDLIRRVATQPNYHGCPFINAAAQFSDPEHPARRAVTRHREWERAVLVDILERLSHPRVEEAADDLMLFRDGALSGSNVGDPVRAGLALARAVERVIAERSPTALAV